MDSGGGRSDSRPVTAKEESVKRNTDCVYFLASPLTCKKGSECEYRHSEGARINPRDCRYWLKGNCLNPKCLFRHPPVDGLVGNPGETSVPLVTAPQITPSMQLSVANSSALNASRNNVPCYYFHKGGCLKGDICPFMHGPQPAVNLSVQPAAKSSVPVGIQLEKPKKEDLGIEKCGSQLNFLTKDSADKPINVSNSSVKGVKVLESTTTNQVHKSSLLPHPCEIGLGRSQETNVHIQAVEHYQHGREDGELFHEPSRVRNSSMGGPVNRQIRSSDDRNQNCKGEGEVLRESSPGFDVLVDNGEKDTEFFHVNDGFTTAVVHGGRNMRTSSSVSERISEKSVSSERRSARRLRSPGDNIIDASDLRHQLMKQRRLNGNLPANSADHRGEPCRRNEQNMRDRSNMDLRRPSVTALSSRLRGRITLPKPSSPEIPFDLQDNRNRVRQRSRLSPVRQIVHQGRHGERSSRRPEEDSATTRNLNNQLKTTDLADSLNFAGPKSLAELKGVKPLKAAVLRESETLSFRGPKPLSALLKRKKEPGLENDVVSAVSYGIKASGERELGFSVSSADPITEMPSVNEVEAIEAVGNLEELGAGAVQEEEEGLIPAEGEQITYEQQDAAEDQELDYADGSGNESKYERMEDEDYGTEDDNHMDVDVDEDDADDFAKKIGLIFS